MRRAVALVSLAALVVALAATLPAGAAGSSPQSSSSFNAKEYKRTHGYLPLKGVATLKAAKEHSAKMVAEGKVPATPVTKWPASPNARNTPVTGANWQGVASSNLTPPDANGAIGPNSYVETVNVKMGIYNRTGGTIATGNLSNFHSGSPTDPMALWDPHTQRFYFAYLNVNNATMVWGFSKSANPTTVNSTSWCSYQQSFGYPTSSIPDYPKLGQTADFLLIGVNFYPTFSSQSATEADLLWIRKPQGTGTVTTCPAQPGSGKFTDLRNTDNTIAFTPTPAIQTDPSSTGYVMTMSDIECPPICGTGTLLTVFTITSNGGNPPSPVLSAPDSITVGSYQSPADADQPGTSNKLDTLDGRITHAVSGVDPRFGVTAVWVAHTVLAPAGAGIRWYEVDAAGGSILQSAVMANPGIDIFNAGISNDRTCTVSSCAHGSAMVLGGTGSSSSLFATIGMVSKVGAGAVSGVVVIKQSTTFDSNFSCSPCRWGDYGGATPDPAASLAAATGKVWLSQQWTAGGGFASSGDRTQNWEATP
ncbi:MAG TPA: hypothetical protein VKA30_06605 [Actinomycetota bacterium]|nr:hypothetical protein [Actinomycetota bacterium]